MVLGFLAKDPSMRTLVLLEGRRIRGDGHNGRAGPRLYRVRKDVGIEF